MLTGERHVFRSTRIVGRLDLSFLTIPVPIEFVGCEFEGRIDLTGAECSKLDLAESNLRQGLTAEFAHIRGPVFLNRGLTSNGQIRFTQATIDGDVDLSRATVTDVGSKPAISLRGAHVLGSVLMHRLRTSGEVRLQHAHIGGLLGLAGAQITVENAVALNLSGAEVTGNIYLDDGFVSTGEICAPGLRLAGALDCQGAMVSNPDGFALRFERARLDSDVRLQGLRTVGEVGFNGAIVGGDVRLAGASIDNGDGIAFGARSTHIRGSLHFDSSPEGEAR